MSNGRSQEKRSLLKIGALVVHRVRGRHEKHALVWLPERRQRQRQPTTHQPMQQRMTMMMKMWHPRHQQKQPAQKMTNWRPEQLMPALRLRVQFQHFHFRVAQRTLRLRRISHSLLLHERDGVQPLNGVLSSFRMRRVFVFLLLTLPVCLQL
jgi:hypothetical protein